MDTKNFLTTISVMAQEIEMLRYYKTQLENEVSKLNKEIDVLTRQKED